MVKIQVVWLKVRQDIDLHLRMNKLNASTVDSLPNTQTAGGQAIDMWYPCISLKNTPPPKQTKNSLSTDIRNAGLLAELMYTYTHLILKWNLLGTKTLLNAWSISPICLFWIVFNKRGLLGHLQLSPLWLKHWWCVISGLSGADYKDSPNKWLTDWENHKINSPNLSNCVRMCPSLSKYLNKNISTLWMTKLFKVGCNSMICDHLPPHSSLLLFSWEACQNHLWWMETHLLIWTGPSLRCK